MIPQGPRTLGYYASSHWFQWAVLFVVIGLLIVVGIIPALDDAKERAERQVVELTIRNMRTGMQLAMGEALMHQREAEMASWAGGNPVQWLGSPPVGYRGACSESERRGLSGGEWCFERSRSELVYQPRNADHLHPHQESKGQKCSQLSWRVVRVPESVARGSFVGLRMESSSACQWLVKGS